MALSSFCWVLESVQRNPDERPQLTTQGSMDLVWSAAGGRKDRHFRKYKQAAALFSLLPAWSALHTCHLFGIRRLVTWLDLTCPQPLIPPPYSNPILQNTDYCTSRRGEEEEVNVQSSCVFHRIRSLKAIFKTCLSQVKLRITNNALCVRNLVDKSTLWMYVSSIQDAYQKLYALVESSIILQPQMQTSMSA
jgi:hypothetical protein